MAAHRKRKQRSLTGRTARTAATIALAGAAVTAFDTAGHASPARTAAEVKAEVDRLYRDAETATEKYNGAKEKADQAARRLNALRDEAARRTDRLNSERHTIGSAATAQYRTGPVDPAVQLVLSSDPGRYLERASLAERADSRQAGKISRIRRELAGITALRTAADGELARLKARRTELKDRKKTINGKLAEARRLLSRLTAEERAKIGASGAPTAGPSAGLARTSSARTADAPNSRAAAAVAYARQALGAPYVWGASGPHAFDCSGLTLAAYRAAGISLPRTTYAQINAGQRVSRAQLQPGDLVFFYSGSSHVGLYIGDGKMIHAPNPSSPVRVAPVDGMPFSGATRVA